MSDTNILVEHVPVRVDGQTLEVCVYSRDSGRDLLFFVHGLGCSGRSFRDVWRLPYFDACSILAPDLVGYGNTAGSDEFSYTMEDQARVCDALLNRFTEHRIHVVAHSMGGAIGLFLSDEIQARVASFVLIEGNLVSRDCGTMSRRAIKVPFERFEKQYFPIMQAHATQDVVGDIDFSRTSARTVYRSSESLVACTDNGSLRERFFGLTCKKAYFHGEKSGNPDACIEKDDIFICAISRSGHFVMNDNPQEFYLALHGFLFP